MRLISWFSCSATSAVACKLILQKYPQAEIVYIETGSHHPGRNRFLRDCEEWFNKKIIILQSRYEDVFDVIKKTKFINSASGASCTSRLKVRVRQEFEHNNSDITHYAWGFEDTLKEKERASKMVDGYRDFIHIFPLISKKLNKSDCLHIIKRADIELPEMYKMGYSNNNYIGCVKGGMGHWNKIRKDFPEIFNKMAIIEREIGYSCLKEEYPRNSKQCKSLFLDELDPNRGRKCKEILPGCSIFCGMINIED